MKWMIVVSILLLIISSGCATQTEGKNEVCIKGTCFTVSIANTSQARGHGLMDAPMLEEDKGMLFIFPTEGNYSFWMRNMRFPLDIVWIGADMRIVYISSYTQPCEPLHPCPSITPPAAAIYILEVNAGKAYDFKIGDNVTFSGNI